MAETFFPQWLTPPQLRLPNRPYGRGAQDWQDVQGLFQGLAPEVLPAKAPPSTMPAPRMIPRPMAPPEQMEVPPLPQAPRAVPPLPSSMPQQERLRPLDYAGLAAVLQSMSPRGREPTLQLMQPVAAIPGRSPQPQIDPILVALTGGRI